MDPNPYESPQPDPPDHLPPEVTPLSLYRDAKRSTGLAVVLLLTPPAIAIATFTTCTVADFGRVGNDIPYMFLCFGVPLAILIACLSLAGIIRARWNNPKRSKHFYVMLWLTPLCMIAAMGAGFGIAIFTFDAAYGRQNTMLLWALPVAFYGPPTVTLLSMLWLAWRHR